MILLIDTPYIIHLQCLCFLLTLWCGNIGITFKCISVVLVDVLLKFPIFIFLNSFDLVKMLTLLWNVCSIWGVLLDLERKVTSLQKKLISWNQTLWKAEFEWIFGHSASLYINVYWDTTCLKRSFFKAGGGVTFEKGGVGFNKQKMTSRRCSIISIQLCYQKVNQKWKY